ncbi:MAG: GNAT family N-acetyltransferase [Rhodosalinus sp.]|uniref:GNAT family N-acetyltransferase n=2 Tax=Rhodosalinus sp. TaxID=2047741 RepID=UPI00397AB6A3
MFGLQKGRYRARLAGTDADLRAAQRLRYVAFAGDSAQDDSAAIDADSFDDRCSHVLVEEVASGRLVCCFRILPLAHGGEITQSYSAQYYELSPLADFEGPIVEMGRFCIHPEAQDPDILRIAWAALTRYVDEEEVKLLFGCASFKGTDAGAYLDAFAMLKERHLGPKRWLPRVKAPNVFRFAARLKRKPDARIAMRRMPPLLKSYLLMGGWVSDHAVVDDHMNTLHVFTGVEVGAIPPARKRLMRAAAQ